MTTQSSNTSAKRSQWYSAPAGVVAGCVTRTMTSPLDVVKIVFQVNHFHNASIADTCRRMFRSHGVKGFWKGNLAGCCRLGPYSGVKFTIFDQLQDAVHPPQALTDPTSLERAMCGAAAGMAATCVVYPMELIRTRLIVSKSDLTIRREAVRIVQTEGVGGLYRGCFSGLLGVIPFEGIQFACYEYGKTYASDHRWPRWRWPQDKTHLHTVDHFVLGSFAGAVAQMVAYPFDTIKKRLQLQPAPAASNATTSAVRHYDGFADCLIKVVRQEGAMALYRGSVPNMVRLVPYAAVMFASYEAAKDLFKAL